MQLTYKYTWLLFGYILAFSAWIILSYSNPIIHRDGASIFLYCAVILAGIWLYKGFRNSKENKLFWLLLLACTAAFAIQGASSLTIQQELFARYEVSPFLILQYLLLFIAFTYQLLKQHTVMFVMQFVLDAIFLIIVTVYLISSWLIDNTQYHASINQSWVFIGYFTSLTLALYGSISVQRNCKHISSSIRKLQVAGSLVICVYDYVNFYMYLHHTFLPNELTVLVHSVSMLLIGLIGAVYTENESIVENATEEQERMDIVHFFLPYVCILIIFQFILLHFIQDKSVLTGLGIAIGLLFLRQMFMWRDNKHLLYTYHSLNEQLEDKVKEGIQALAKSEQQYKSLFEDHPDAVFSLDNSGNFQSVNKSCTEILGYTHKELIGQAFLNYVIEDDQYATRDFIRKTKNGSPQTFEVRAHRKHGECYYLQVTLIPTMLEDKPIGMYGIARDTTELKENERQIEHMAFHDALTGLANRRKFENRLAAALKTATERETMAAVLFIDLDRFKKINDRLGHDIGDLLLIEIGKRLEQTLRSKDVVARQGGDEFTVLLTDVFSKQGATLVAERLLNLLNEPLYIKGHELKVTPSIGIALYPSHGTNVTKLMKNADIAMYRAKASGKNKYMFYSSEMSDVEDEKHFLEGELNRALQNNELILQYQPQVNIETNDIVGFEALVRWQHPKFGLVSPAQFIPLAEETGLIIPMGEWILRTACQQAKEWHDKGYAHLKVAVNLSPLQFNQANLVELVADILQETQLPVELLDLEITEGIAINKEEQVIEKLEHLKQLGVKISIDDFGTGYSSLSYLTKYPIDTLKIAREFIQEIGTSPQEEAIISSIIMMAKNLHLTVIAEGVEVHEQWTFLKEHQCDQVQGYFISRPLDKDKVWDLLLRNRIKLASKTRRSS